jgi:lipid-A-disaccharide synthase
MNPPLHFALVAGELSGDILGAALIRALRARYPGARFSGVAGPRMVAEGCEAVDSIEALSLMGIAEVLPAIPRLFKLRAALVARYAADRPEVFIGIDAPDFNLGLERRLKARGVPTVHMVSPSVWAWREGRIHGIRRSVDLMLCLLPFETSIYQRHGLPAVFVGHPLADELSSDTPATLARHTLGLPETLTLAVLPGSRGGEVSKLAVPFAQAAARLHAALPQLQCVTPVAKPSVRSTIAAAIAEHAPQVPWTLLDGRSRLAMQAADAVLLASGTATLECLLLGRPMVVGYRVAAFTAFLLRRLGLLKIEHVSLPNLLCGQALVPELLQDDCSPERLAAALQPLLLDTSRQASQISAFEAVRGQLRRDAASLSAEAIGQLLPTR